MSTKIEGPRTGRKLPKQGEMPKGPSLSDQPELQEKFQENWRVQDTLHLLQEHREQMQASQALHQTKLWNIRQQLQIQLFKIWNEVWLQKRATYDKAHKEWLKVFAA